MCGVFECVLHTSSSDAMEGDAGEMRVRRVPQRTYNRICGVFIVLLHLRLLRSLHSHRVVVIERRGIRRRADM